MDEFFKGCRIIGVLMASAVAASCSTFNEQDRNPEGSHPSQRIAKPNANKPPNGVAPSEILMKFAIDEQGLATDEQVEGQIKNFSMSDFSGWNQDDGWSVLVGLDRVGALEAMGLEEEKLKDASTWGFNSVSYKMWRISPSYRLKFTRSAHSESTLISFPKQ